MVTFPKGLLACCVCLLLATIGAWSIPATVDEPFETQYGGAPVSDGLDVNPTNGALPAPTAYTSPNPAMVWGRYGKWDAAHWVEWVADESPFSGTGSFSLAWRATAASLGDQTRLVTTAPTSTDLFTNGGIFEFDLKTNDDNPEFGLRCNYGNTQSVVILVGQRGRAGKMCYRGYNGVYTDLCTFERNTWYHVSARINQALNVTGTITYTIQRWVNGQPVDVVRNLTIAYVPDTAAALNARYEYACFYNDNLLASGSTIAGGGCTQLDNLQIRACGTPALPGSVLKTNANGIYSEGIPDLDVLNHHVTRPPNRPTPPGDLFNPPGLTTVPGSASPAIATYTRNAPANRSMILSGKQFTVHTGASLGKDTRVWVYDQTSATDGSLYEATLLREEDGAVTAVIDAGAPYGMYLAWVQNAAGVSYPVRINATDAWWLGPNHACAGDAVSVYGCNLSHANGTTTSYIYLRPWGADAGTATTACAVTGVNPYKVTFTVPNGLAAGDYEIWAHNGHGGQFGWSGPLKLKVDASPYAWNGTVHDITAYGAIADDGLNDTTAIQAAVTAAQPGDVVYIPSGTFHLNACITSARGIKIEGAGSAVSVLATLPTFSGAAMIRLTGSPVRVCNLGFISTRPSFSDSGMLSLNGYNVEPPPTGQRVDHCAFSAPSDTTYYAIVSGFSRDVRITDNTATGGRMVWINKAIQAQVCRNTFLGNGHVYGSNAFINWSSREFDFSGNVASSQDRANSLALKRLWVSQCGNGASFNGYLGHNESNECGPLADDADVNGGENILLETGSTFYVGSPTAVTATTLTVSGAGWTNDAYVTDDLPGWDKQMNASLLYIQRGTGAGQWRRIIGNTSDTITVDRPWDITPDTASVFCVQRGAARHAIYHNDLDGVADYADRWMGQWGILLFRVNHDTFITSNTMARLRNGIGLTGWTRSLEQPAAGKNVEATSNTLVADNTLTHCYLGIALQTDVTPAGTGDSGMGPVVVGNIVRDNALSSIDTYGFSLERMYTTHYWKGTWAMRNVLEYNTVTDAQTAVLCGKYQGLNTFRANSFTRSAFTPGTVGITFDADNEGTYLYDNAYNVNIETAYGGTLPGAGGQCHTRALAFDATLNGSNPAAQTLAVRNVGTASLALTVDDDAAWLSATLSSATVADERDSVTLTVSVDKTGLAPGRHAGTITLTGGAQFSPHTVGVIFDVQALAGVPTAPVGVSAVGTGTTQITVSWTDGTGETGYNVERSADGLTGWAQIGTAAADATSYPDNGRTTGVLYYYRVRATNATGASYPSVAVSAATITAAVSTLTATACSSTAIDLAWSDVAGETSYRIERSPNGAGNWALAGTTGADVLTFRDATCAANTIYDYRVCAVNAGGNGGWSPTASATTYLLPTPGNLTATIASTAQIDLAWSDVAGETGYTVERSPDGSTGWAQIGTTNANVTAFPHTGLTAGTAHFYRVRATAAGGTSHDSAVVWQAALPTGGMALWLAGNGALITDGAGLVSRWETRVGTGHAAQPLACYQPTFIANRVNGQPALAFDGTYDNLHGALSMNTNAATVFFVYKPVSVANTRGIFSMIDGTNHDGTTNGCSFRHYTTSGLVWYLDGTAIRTTSAPAGAWYVMTGVINGATATLYKNGVSQGTAAITDRARPTEKYGVSCRMGPSPWNPGNNEVAEVVVYSTALADADRLAVESYLRAKYGL